MRYYPNNNNTTERPRFLNLVIFSFNLWSSFTNRKTRAKGSNRKNAIVHSVTTESDIRHDQHSVDRPVASRTALFKLIASKFK